MENLEGYVDNIVFQNEENGYMVFDLVTEDEEVRCAGIGKGITRGETVAVTGDFAEHPVYGRQFKVSSYKAIMPKDSAGMERYLASGAIKGVGAALAARIVKKFGSDTFRIIEEEPERLAEVKGISEHKAQEIGVQMEEKKDLREAFLYMQQFGISNSIVVKIYEKYGVELYGVIRENPYRLAEDISGIGFKIADEIAIKLGIHADSDYRIRCGIQHVLQGAVRDGHCYLPMDILLARAHTLLSVEEDVIRSQVVNLTMDRKLVLKGEKVYIASYYYAELNCAAMLHKLNIPVWEEGELPARREAVYKKLEQMTSKLQMEMDDLQLQAVMTSICNGLFILSGGPGTGKTTTINMMLRYFEAEGLDILLAAPTGRAAKRMAETTGFEARTIHRLLELNSVLSDGDDKVRFERNEQNPLEADVIIIDEMSMVDILLFQALLKSIVPGTRLILVGDVDQLPSVGPGQVLRDIMDSKCFPMVNLQKIFRQAEESDIVVNAHRINRGEQIALDNKSQDFFMLERDDTNVIYKHMIQLIQEKLPPFVNATSMDIQVLTPMRKGPLGCITLNAILQRYLNPPAPAKKEHVAGDTVYREGDKVMQIKNNYQLEWEVVSCGIPIDQGTGVFNGDMGKILRIDEMLSELVVEYDEHRRVKYPFALLEELELSYAVTVHKSQGSEYPAVILPLLDGPPVLFNRNLLYTAITRARSCVTILGSSRTVRKMIENVSEKNRFTGLRDRISEMARREDDGR